MAVRSILLCASMVAAMAMVGSSASAGVLVVEVTGAPDDSGKIDCALYSSEKGFPMEPEKAMRTSMPTQNKGGICRFEGLPAGTYAIAASHDENENGVTDTNFLGIPYEAWGVSNGVRPFMRPPTFEEAAFDLSGEGETLLKIKITTIGVRIVKFVRIGHVTNTKLCGGHLLA